VVFDSSSEVEDQCFEYFKKQTLLALQALQLQSMTLQTSKSIKKIDNKLLLATMLSEYVKKKKTL
jgi:hypothetical protein